MPELKAVREKYKDNPQKQQAATMELYKKHKVNPVAGCIPMLLTIPFFFAFFRMLQSAAELRFAPLPLGARPVGAGHGADRGRPRHRLPQHQHPADRALRWWPSSRCA